MSQLATRPIVPKTGLKPRRMKATKAEQERYSIVAVLGCICCRQLGFHTPAELHHPTSGGRRIGNDKVIPLCKWHHQEKITRGSTKLEMFITYGPTLHSKREFVSCWGTELELLEQVNKLLEAK